MGTWGTAIFADDIAADVQDAYRQALGDGAGDADATTSVLGEFTDADGWLSPVVWLALAATQHRLGRQDERVRDEALRIIDEGIDLLAWLEAPVESQRGRAHALAKLRTQLTGTLPPRRTVRRQWRPVTDLTAGSVLGCRLETGSIRLLRVVRVVVERTGTFPLLELLDHDTEAIPPTAKIEALPTAHRRTPLGRKAGPRRWVVGPHHRGEPDWRTAGFELVAVVAPRAGDAEARDDETWSGWQHLRDQLTGLEWYGSSEPG